MILDQVFLAMGAFMKKSIMWRCAGVAMSLACIVGANPALANSLVFNWQSDAYGSSDSFDAVLTGSFIAPGQFQVTGISGTDFLHMHILRVARLPGSLVAGAIT